MSLRYHLIYYAVACLLLVMSLLVHWLFWGVLFFYGIFIFLRLNWCHLVLMIFIVIGFGLLLQWPQEINEKILTGKVVSIDSKSAVINCLQTKVKVWGKWQGVYLDDEVKIMVTYLQLSPPTNEGQFNYRNYLYSQGITKSAKLEKILEYRNNPTLLQRMQQRIVTNDTLGSYVSMFILGLKNELLEADYQQMKDLSIVHLFALSGMHIQILKSLLERIFKYFFSPKIREFLIIVLLGGYVWIIPFNISFARAYLMILLTFVFHGYLNKLDCLGLVSVFMLIINPYVIFSAAFIFSYFIYLVILLLNRKQDLDGMLFLASIPLVLMVQYRLNIWTFILGIVLVPIIKFLYSMIWIYVFLGEIVAGGVWLGIYFLDNIIKMTHDFSWYLNFSQPDLLFFGAYYFVYFKMILKYNLQRNFRREIILLFCVLAIFFLKPYFNPESQVVMLDVGQGDCFIIRQPFNRGNIMIDTGGSKHRDLATTTLVPYLRSQGIHTLDYVFISHNDFDHCGAYDSLAKQIRIKHKITKYQEEMRIGQVLIKMFKSNITDNANDRSLVFKARINNLEYLFTGDISKRVEFDLLKSGYDLKADVLKVGHHGSNSSTGGAFLEAIKPKIALISCGKGNLYGHPHQAVLERLKDYDVQVYRSDLDGQVKISYYNGKNYLFR